MRVLERSDDVERCACGGQLKIRAGIEDPVVIVRILTHLGLPARAPPHFTARAPSLVSIQRLLPPKVRKWAKAVAGAGIKPP